MPTTRSWPLFGTFKTPSSASGQWWWKPCTSCPSPWEAQKALWEIFETGTVQLLPLGEDDIPHMKRLMEKYRDLPMDLADAALVWVAEREGLPRVFTLDRRHFNVYRLPRKKRFVLLP